MSVLDALNSGIASGAVRIVDLTHPLTPDFPVMILPPEFGQCQPFRMEEVSRYDARGPGWYWNNISMSEHAGTHFDAPAHWVSGRQMPQGTVDALPVERLVAPVVVLDFSIESAADRDFLLTREHVLAWEAAHGRIAPGQRGAGCRDVGTGDDVVAVAAQGVGAVLALYVTGTTINIVAFIGVIMLAGIVVNNAIVLVDLINQLRAAGKDKLEAIYEAGAARLRPILMTSLTTTLGLLPMAMGFGEGSEVRTPMAITVIGGLAVSTLLTLIVIPVVYSLMDRR